MTSSADVVQLYNEEKQHYTYGAACVAAARAVEEWLIGRKDIQKTSTITAWLTTSDGRALEPKETSPPHRELTICTRTFRLTDDCMWIEQPFDGFHVVFASMHEVMPAYLTDVGHVLVDITDQYWNAAPSLRLYLR